MSPKKIKIALWILVASTLFIWAMFEITISIKKDLAGYKTLLIDEESNTQLQQGSLRWLSVYSPDEKASILIRLKDYNAIWKHDTGPDYDSALLTDKNTGSFMSISRKKTQATKQWRWFVTTTHNGANLLYMEEHSDDIQSIADELFGWKAR